MLTLSEEVTMSAIVNHSFFPLPDELFGLVLENFGPNDLINATLVCKKWQREINKIPVWQSLFKRIYSSFYHSISDCHSLPISPLMNWKEIFITTYQWTHKKYKTTTKDLESDQPVSQSFEMDIYVSPRILNQIYSVELWDKFKNERLEPSEESHSTLIYSFQDSISNTWKVSLHILSYHSKFPLLGNLNLKCKLADTLTLQQEKIAEKMKNLQIVMVHPITQEQKVIPLLVETNRYRNLIYKNSLNIRVGDEKALKIYASPDWTLEEEIEIPFDHGFFSDIAITAKKMIAIEQAKLLAFEIQDTPDQKRVIRCLWSKDIEEGLKKQIIIPEDEAPFFGLFGYHLNPKTLDIFNRHTGECLFSLNPIQARAIKINFECIQYINESNQLVTHSFKRPNAKFSLEKA